MTLALCRILYRIVMHGSFVKAAEALRMTPSAVSHAVSDAESALGFRLFNRTKNGITLTQNGKEIYPAVLQMLRSEGVLDQIIDNLKGLQSGTVTLGVLNSVCTNWMPDIFQRFHADFPNIQINIYEGGYGDVAYWIKNGFTELGFLSTSYTTELMVDGRYQDPLVCIVPQDFPNKKAGIITLAEMKDQHLIIQRRGSDTDVQKLFQKYDFHYHANCHFQDDTSIIAMITCGQGISVMPMLTATGLVQGLKVLRIQPEEHRVIGLSSLDLERLSPAAKKLYQCINAYMEEKNQLYSV